MQLQLFPLDTQTCQLQIESYGNPASEVEYFWGAERTDNWDEAVVFGGFMLPQYEKVGYRLSNTTSVEYDGNYVGGGGGSNKFLDEIEHRDYFEEEYWVLFH